MKKLGKILKQRRIDLNLTQEELAELLGVSRMTVSVWEHGGNLPSLRNLTALETALKLPKGTLMIMACYGDNMEIESNGKVPRQA